MSEIDRRQLLAAIAGATVAPALADVPRRDLIAAENDRDGTLDWQLTYTRVDPKTKWRSPMIEGFASRSSVRGGDAIEFFVSTDPATPFTIDVYRLGYYRGKGGRHMLRLGPYNGKAQPTPPVGDKRLRECQWEPCTTLYVPKDWPSGVYLGKLSASKHRYQSYIICIVRDDRAADFVFQCSDHTWQAYNQWPDGYSHYTNDRKDKKPLVSGVRVSFDRPYGNYVQIFDNPLSQGSGEFLLWEFPLAFWMEQRGYDVTYCCNGDVATDLKCLTRARTFLSVGHDEYWARSQYDHTMAAVKAGVNIAFLSGNTCCFVLDMTPSAKGTRNRVIERVGRYGGIRPKEHPWMEDLPVEAPNEATLIGAQTV